MKHFYSATPKSCQIPLPTLTEQKAIAEILSDLDAAIKALEKKRDQYKAIKYEEDTDNFGLSILPLSLTIDEIYEYK